MHEPQQHSLFDLLARNEPVVPPPPPPPPPAEPEPEPEPVAFVPDAEEADDDPGAPLPIADDGVAIGQTALFDVDALATAWQEWGGMPEMEQRDLSPYKTLLVHFESAADVARFAALVGQRIIPSTKFIWYPEAEIGRYRDKRFIAG